MHLNNILKSAMKNNFLIMKHMEVVSIQILLYWYKWKIYDGMQPTTCLTNFCKAFMDNSFILFSLFYVLNYNLLENHFLLFHSLKKTKNKKLESGKKVCLSFLTSSFRVHLDVSCQNMHKFLRYCIQLPSSSMSVDYSLLLFSEAQIILCRNLPICKNLHNAGQ